MDNRDYQGVVNNALSAAYAIIRSDVKAGRVEEVDDTAVRTMLMADRAGVPYHPGRMKANVAGLGREQFLKNAARVLALSKAVRGSGFYE